MAEQQKKQGDDLVDEAASYIDEVISDVLANDLSPEDQRQVLIKVRDSSIAALDDVTERLLMGADLDEDATDEDEEEPVDDDKAGA